MFENTTLPQRPFLVVAVLVLVASLVQAQAPEVTQQRVSTSSLVQIDPLSESNTDLLGEYRLALQRLQQLEVYNQNLASVVADQQRAMTQTRQKFDNYERSRQDLVPLMVDMIETLERFIELDLPFYLDERRERVAKLRENLDESGISNSEKIRRILEAYQFEMDFGRTLDAETGWLESEGQRREVNFLRVGRVVLAYQTHDRSETGFFNPLQRQWQTLPDEYRSHVADGLRIAKKQAAPNLIRLPVPAPGAAW